MKKPRGLRSPQTKIPVNLKNRRLSRHEQTKNCDFGAGASKSDGRIKDELVPLFLFPDIRKA